MADQQSTETAAQDYTQLSQARVPIHQAADVLSTKDAAGRTPIVVLVERANRTNNTALMAASIILIVSLLLWLWRGNAIIGIGGIVIALVLAGVTYVRSLYVTVPEGAGALLTQRGRYTKTLGPGYYPLSPYIRVSHVVSRREIPFEVPVIDAPTKDNVRAGLDVLVTFTITEPYRFVYNLSASDFDRVFQAACQNALRTMVRGISSSEISDLTGRDNSDLRTSLNAAMEAYGVEIQKVNITSARPPADFMASREARELAVVQEVEQAQKQTLAMRMQADQETLARQAVIAQVDRDHEVLQTLLQAAENRKQLVELEAAAERLRLERLQERLEAFPVAAKWEVESAQLDIARGLAGNTRAVVQVGDIGDIPRAFMFTDSLKELTTPGNGRPVIDEGQAIKEEGR
jgi:regulator of protease activity HflC (stomatin/prohibitin superfamily)